MDISLLKINYSAASNQKSNKEFVDDFSDGNGTRTHTHTHRRNHNHAMIILWTKRRFSKSKMSAENCTVVTGQCEHSKRITCAMHCTNTNTRQHWTIESNGNLLIVRIIPWILYFKIISFFFFLRCQICMWFYSAFNADSGNVIEIHSRKRRKNKKLLSWNACKFRIFTCVLSVALCLCVCVCEMMNGHPHPHPHYSHDLWFDLACG